ncbi:unannotated protein [freshwater metagenome]|uniref:Unannotated protein n=1 Tax=freshwater metagenome TaxID=449393 RepID=A0A6J6IHA3_9ZZZZ|nr:hypothetical protein [Actinomycetota bacterium]MSZ23761.1 hypothetical protein [Actinomycetota bacterium]MSZ93124.1 hypothetical protein [Actinomycetota bacterium]
MAEQLEHPYGTINVELVGAWLHMKPEDDGCFWALNLMKYVEVANYDDGREGVSGKSADDAYSPVGPLAAVGAAVAYLGDVKSQPLGTPMWDRVGIIRYPTRASFFEMQERKDFKEAHVHKKAGMDFTIILSCLPNTHDASASTEGDLVLLIDKGTDDAFAAVQGVTQVALFDVEGVIIGDERRYDRARFVRVNDDETLASLISAAENAEDAQILVLRSFIDNLVDTVVTA